jgi:hypothetical protein
MGPRGSDRTGILIMRVWIEPNSRDAFRARIMHSLDASAPEQLMATASTPQEICTIVESWVEGFVATQ